MTLILLLFPFYSFICIFSFLLVSHVVGLKGFAVAVLFIGELPMLQLD